MKITKDQVLYVADLARLDLDDAQVDPASRSALSETSCVRSSTHRPSTQRPSTTRDLLSVISSTYASSTPPAALLAVEQPTTEGRTRRASS